MLSPARPMRMGVVFAWMVPGVDDWLVDTLAACLAPAVIAGMFVVGAVLGVSASSQSRLPTQLRRATAQVLPTQVAYEARGLARSMRSFVSRL